MDINAIVKDFENCPCGREHKSSVKAVEIDNGVISEVGKILKENGFPKKIFLLADNASIAAADGIIENIEKAGFTVEKFIYPVMKKALMTEVEKIRDLSSDCDGLLAVGTGSVNDICRYASFLDKKAFAIFGTAPSMDGFASSVAPIINNGFKMSLPSHQPSVIMADTKILANAPLELKAAGFGDVIGKKIARVDWEISRLLTGEYFCENIASLIDKAVDTLISLSDKIQTNDETAAKAEMEALVLSGLSISLAGSSRPASGAEHMIAHMWEIKEIEAGRNPQYHGRYVSVATVLANKIYRKIAQTESIEAHKENIDFNTFSDNFGFMKPEIIKLNVPPVTDEVDPTLLKERWRQITETVNKFLPTDSELDKIMKNAGAVTMVEEVGISKEIEKFAVEYHPFIRHRITLTRLLPMIEL